MSPDDYQRAWQAESSKTRITVDADSLLNAVQQSQKELRRAVSWGYTTAILMELPLIPVFLFLGFTIDSAWTWWLIVVTLFWSAGYKLVALRYGKKFQDASAEALVGGVKESLALVEYQIQSGRKTFWWTQLPMAIAITIFFFHTTWQLSQNWMEALGSATFFFSIVAVIYGSTYFLYKRVERKHHEPRRQELLILLASLDDDSSSEVSGEYPLLMSGDIATSVYYKPSRRRRILAVLCFLVLLTLGVGGAFFARDFEDGYPKKSPFAAVRWEVAQPEVRVGDVWYELVSLDDIPAVEIVDFSKRTFGDRWQRRFEEDLVELLTRMGHPPEGTVSLVLQSLTSSEMHVLEDVPMTRANRRAIRDAAQSREDEGRQKERREAVSTADSVGEDPSLAQELEKIRAAYDFPAMAAFTLRGSEIVERATVGARSTKDDMPIGPDAQWHLGSNTKAMTATVAGMLVEEGLLQWDSTIGAILGEAAPNMDPENRDTTLTMLLQHRSGIAANISWYSAPEDRVACAAQILSTTPGERGSYVYSNAGYVVAGAMMEVVTGKRWEDLMQERLFAQLGMTNTSFGAPSKPGAPWGHRSGVFGWKPMDPATRGSDNALVLGPAGTVHATLEDYAKFVAAHLAGARGEGGLVSAETFATLHTPHEGADYAMGWKISERGWAGGRTLSHSGSNTMWFATVWIAQEKNLAYFAATNVGGEKAFEAVDAAIVALIDRQAK